MSRPLPLLVAILALVPAGLVGQNEAPDGPVMPLLTDVTGDFSRPIDTESTLAQAYFDQGMQMVYAFTYPVAIRSFQEAQRQDPDCAMCYWGEAQARGPFLNSKMTQSNAPLAYEAAQRALSLIDETDDPVEKGLIRAMSIRYAETHTEENRVQLDSAYSQAMADLHQAYPNDLDVGALYAESLMLLNTERWGYETSDPFVQSIHRTLEDVLAQDIHHPGACHLFIHATEATEVAYKAEACADLLMTAVPGSSHLNHMPSHTYNVLGRWGKAVRSNAMAWRSDDRTADGRGVSYAATHNLHMLFYAGSMDGQGQVSTAAAAEYARQVNGGVFYHSMVLLRFGEFQKVLELTDAPEEPLRLGLWEFSRGYAHLRTGSPDSAAVYLERVDEKARTLEDVRMRAHSAHDLLGITGDILRGEILRSEGRLDEAIEVFERAVETHDGLRYDEPEPLNFSARHWLGDALLEAGRYTDAEDVYRAALEQHPDNGWSWFGLEKALRSQGRTAEADQAKAEFDRAWARADVVIHGSIF
ncbi:MAG: tetratricopeptide repeat protein [Gemmatimonadota bacterium]